MRVCRICNTTLEDNVQFCPTCGNSAAVSNPVPTTPAPSNPAPTYSSYYQPAPKAPISIGGWIGRSLIPCIPLVGWLVYLIMLFIWSGDTAKEETFRNWAKAQLIVMAIAIVLTVVLILIFGTTLAAVANSYY